MSQRAALYTVSVRPRAGRGSALLLGDLDGAGTSALSALAGILDGFSEQTADGSRVVRVLSAARREQAAELFAVLQHGQSGVAADIVDATGAVRLRQHPDDLQLVQSGCLLRLPPAERTGALAVHVNNGRGAKELFQQGLTRRFRSAFPGLSLAIERLADSGELRDAIAQNKLVRLQLACDQRPGEQQIAPTAKWLGPSTGSRVTLTISAQGTDGRIEPALVERFLGGDTAAFAEICNFAGLAFAQAGVTALLPDGKRRTFDLAHPDSGLPAMRQLKGIELDADGEPTAASLQSALRAALTAAGP